MEIFPPSGSPSPSCFRAFVWFHLLSALGIIDIGRISLRTAAPLFYDSYRRKRLTGSLILIDPGIHEIVAAGMTM